MSLETLAAFFGWCTVINFSLLVVTTIVLFAGRKPILKFHASIFGLKESILASAYFQYLAQYKIVTLTLNVAPYIALKILASTAT